MSCINTVRAAWSEARTLVWLSRSLVFGLRIFLFEDFSEDFSICRCLSTVDMKQIAVNGQNKFMLVPV